MNRVVIDASVAVRWFTHADYRGQAVALRDVHIQGKIKLVAPMMFWFTRYPMR